MTLASVKRLPGLDHIHYISRSIDYDPVRLDQNRVRANLLLGGWNIKQTDQGVRLSYIFQVDVCGYIPSTLLKTVQSRGPLIIQNIGQYLAKKGPLPFIVQDSLQGLRGIQITKNHFDPSKNKYDLRILSSSLKEPAKLSVAFPQQRFDGVSFSVQGVPSDKIHVGLPSRVMETFVSKSSKLILDLSLPYGSEVSVSAEPLLASEIMVNGQVTVIDIPPSPTLSSPTTKSLLRLKATHQLNVKTLIGAFETMLGLVDHSWAQVVESTACTINQTRARVRNTVSYVRRLPHLPPQSKS